MPETLVTKKDLANHGIKYTWATLNKFMDNGVFPPSVRLSPGRVAWRLTDIEKFIDNLPDGRVRRLDSLWRPRPSLPPRPGKRRGRQAGTKIMVIDGRRRVVPAADAAE